METRILDIFSKTLGYITGCRQFSDLTKLKHCDALNVAPVEKQSNIVC